jgi:hypothetical protein
MGKIKRLLFIVLVLGSVSSVLFIVFMVRSNSDRSQAPIGISEGAIFENLKPGVSTLDDVVAQFGTSDKETATGSSKILEYESKNPNFNNEFKITDDKVDFIKQIVTMQEGITVKSINEEYGIYRNILYGPLSQNGFHLYAYPDKGIAYIGNQNADIVLEIWYFPPTTIEQFMSLYAQDYSERYKPRQ